MNLTPPSDDFDELAALVDEQPTNWEPAPGDKIVGSVLRFDIGQNERGSWPVVILRDRGGAAVRIDAGNVVLRKRLEQLRVQPGDVLAIKFVGARTSKAGRTYNDFHAESKPVGARDPETAFTAPPDDGLNLVADAYPDKAPF